MVNRAELTGAGVRNADMDVRVFANRKRQVRRHWRKPSAVRGFHAPAIAAQEFPLAALQVQPVQPETVGVTVRGDEHVGSIVAIEVAFNVADHVVGAILAAYFQVVARILAGGAKFSQVSLDRVAEGMAAK